MARPNTSTDNPNELDGRALRGARNRERIVEALLALVREGELLPTAEQVSQRAGVGTRTVFRHFDDMESLNSEMQTAIQREVRPLLDAPPEKGSLEHRARSLIERRVAIFERIAPFMRSAAMQRWNTPYLQRNHLRTVSRLRADLRRWLPEVSDLSEPLAEALELATSFEAWNRLRTDQRLGRERAEAVLQAAVLALLGCDSPR